MNFGSVNLAEMMPYFQALSWYHNAHGMRRLKERCPLLVHVITDSQVTALHGNRAASGYESLPKIGHRALWAAMREFKVLGYQIEYHWAERNDSGLNNLADLIAGLSRRVVKNINPVEVDSALSGCGADAVGQVTFKDPKTGCPISPYEINPIEEPNAERPDSEVE